MINLPLASIPFMMKIIAVLFVLVAVALILVILVQKGKGGGLGAAFGGGAASSLLGTKTGDFLTWFTIGATALFLLMAVLLGLFFRPDISEPVQMQRPPVSAPMNPAQKPQRPAPTGLGGQGQTETPAGQKTPVTNQ